MALGVPLGHCQTTTSVMRVQAQPKFECGCDPRKLRGCTAGVVSLRRGTNCPQGCEAHTCQNRNTHVKTKQKRGGARQGIHGMWREWKDTHHVRKQPGLDCSSGNVPPTIPALHG
eukprot:6149897-Prymnesium_polylepis.6